MSRLTTQTSAGGCASKLSPGILDQVLARIPRWANENVLVGFDTADDAGVYKLSPELALVQTVDFFTPVVDDPYTFGAIAAANAISDIYAMGGKPISALSILAWPPNGDLDELAEILKGGAEKLHEADCAVLGGHSVRDEEVKFGYAVTGTIHPDCIKTNAGARPGDALVFTKRIGTGVISTALKQGIAKESDVAAATASMLKLNREACEAMLAVRRAWLHRCHRLRANGPRARDGARKQRHARDRSAGRSVSSRCGGVCAARRDPRRAQEQSRVRVIVRAGAAELSPEFEDLLYDPQTSGGLLIALPERDAASLQAKHPAAYRIGQVTERQNKPIRLL